MPFSVTCVALDTTRGFVVLSISEFEVRSRLLLIEWSIVVEGKLSFVVIISYHMISYDPFVFPSIPYFRLLVVLILSYK